MDERITRLKTSKDARTFAKNARERGHLDLETQALQRARELQAIEAGYTSSAQQAIAAALYAYEEHQSRLKGRTFRATRTRQMLANRGALDAAERMVLNRQPSKGYEVLEEAGLQELSFEAIIVRFPDEFSERAVEAARARLEGRPLPFLAVEVASSSDSSTDHEGIDISSSIKLDAEALDFLEGFKDPGIWHRASWLPRYRRTTQDIAQALVDDQLENPFDILWKRAHNDISNAGQGVLKYDTVDEMRDEFVQVIRDIYQDDSPANFERMVERFEGWKVEGRIGMVPRLLIARAFAGVHPHRYHTTVDASTQNEMLGWFVEHTGFVIPRSTGWAARAQALVKHLDRANLFGEDFHARNIFPWFVVDQLRGRSMSTDIPPGHAPRPASAFADLPPAQRFIELRHNVVQDALFAQLKAEFGKDRVWTEYPTGTGGFADALVRHSNACCHLYEIKIAATATQVVRQAMGQLLEYSFRVGGLEPVKLFAVGEPVLDDVTRRFLARLRDDFNLEIDYLQIKLPDGLALSP
ncbi:hypothetical protein [Rhodanobacter sp. C01]|uniref:hypothetical protein n=1 Tax=Rhodanobacter sp. C01 TaxID=1945856 RepID=UPI0009862794|nr:hypothetical protein [Rhodanobacter sp. C01]OOG46740.1 hypothetical protein B0E50_12150 [Rhodanobacter sp. C01]